MAKTKPEKKKRTSFRCPVCGFRVRGKNHNDGPHHNNFSDKGQYKPSIY